LDGHDNPGLVATRRLWNPTLAQKAAQGWGTRLVAAQNAAQSQNGDTLFLKLIQEEVIFI